MENRLPSAPYEFSQTTGQEWGLTIFQIKLLNEIRFLSPALYEVFSWE